MPPVIPGVTPARPAPSAAPAYLDALRVTNPKIDELMAKTPGLRAFLDRADAAGAVVHGATGTQVATDHQWSMWSHSPKSASLPKNWRDEVIVVFQTDTNKKHMVDFGAEKFQGSIIGVFSKGQVFTDDVVRKDASGVEGGFSADDGFEALMKVRTVGEPGAAAGVSFATGMLDAQGKADGYWGWPGEYDYAKGDFGGGGYDGRQIEFTHGTPDIFPVEDHGVYSILKPVPHAPGEVPFVYVPYKAPVTGHNANDHVDRTGGRTNVLNTIGGSSNNTVSTGTPAGGGTNPLLSFWNNR